MLKTTDILSSLEPVLIISPHLPSIPVDLFVYGTEAPPPYLNTAELSRIWIQCEEESPWSQKVKDDRKVVVAKPLIEIWRGHLDAILIGA
jgi:hypothetical protein